VQNRLNPDVDINCFGCARANPIGLKLEFQESNGHYLTTTSLGRNYESYPGIIHGGIIATILDEILCQAVYRDGGASAFTVALRLRYGCPMETDVVHTAIAKVLRAESTMVRAEGRIEKQNGDLVAAASGSFHVISDVGLDEIRARSAADD
jgi:uncharacterized protein (TIGR00369 family)